VTADELALHRRARLRKLERHDRLRDFIVGKLRAHWSPEQIAGYLRHIDGIDGTGMSTAPRAVI
jgi:IS30 family transposase